MLNTHGPFENALDDWPWDMDDEPEGPWDCIPDCGGTDGASDWLVCRAGESPP